MKNRKITHISDISLGEILSEARTVKKTFIEPSTDIFSDVGNKKDLYAKAQLLAGSYGELFNEAEEVDINDNSDIVSKLLKFPLLQKPDLHTLLTIANDIEEAFPTHAHFLRDFIQKSTASLLSSAVQSKIEQKIVPMRATGDKDKLKIVGKLLELKAQGKLPAFQPQRGGAASPPSDWIESKLSKIFSKPILEKLKSDPVFWYQVDEKMYGVLKIRRHRAKN